MRSQSEIIFELPVNKRLRKRLTVMLTQPPVDRCRWWLGNPLSSCFTNLLK